MNSSAYAQHSRKVLIIYRFQGKGICGGIGGTQIELCPDLSPRKLFLANSIVSSPNRDDLPQLEQVNMLSVHTGLEIELNPAIIPVVSELPMDRIANWDRIYPLSVAKVVRDSMNSS